MPHTKVSRFFVYIVEHIALRRASAWNEPKFQKRFAISRNNASVNWTKGPNIEFEVFSKCTVTNNRTTKLKERLWIDFSCLTKSVHFISNRKCMQKTRSNENISIEIWNSTKQNQARDKKKPCNKNSNVLHKSKSV